LNATLIETKSPAADARWDRRRWSCCWKEDVVMQTERTGTAFRIDAPIVPSQSAVDQIASTSDDKMADDGDIWMPMAPPCEPTIWPRVWPGL
jgi:hypothetical protein